MSVSTYFAQRMYIVLLICFAVDVVCERMECSLD
jgi:hypothetical protein